MPQVGKSNLGLMNAILNTALDSMLVSMAQNSALQNGLSYAFGKPFFPSILKPKEEKDGPRITTNWKTSLEMKITFNLISLILVRK